MLKALDADLADADAAGLACALQLSFDRVRPAVLTASSRPAPPTSCPTGTPLH